MSVRIVECVPKPHRCDLPEPTDMECTYGTLIVCDDCDRWYQLRQGDWSEYWCPVSSVAWKRSVGRWAGPAAFLLGLAVFGWVFFEMLGG